MLNSFGDFCNVRDGKHSDQNRCFSGFSLVELLVVISVISLLASLALPAVARAKSRARSIQCLSNLRQIGIALHVYADTDPAGLLPLDPRGTNAPAWIDSLQPHLGDVDSVRTCPADRLGRLRRAWRRTSYVLNEYTSTGLGAAGATPDAKNAIVFPGGDPVEVYPSVQKLSLLRRPSETFLVFEGSNLGTVLPEPGDLSGGRPIYDDHTHPDTWSLGWPHVLADIDPYRHGNSACYLFADGHAASIAADSLKRRIDSGDNFAAIPE